MAVSSRAPLRVLRIDTRSVGLAALRMRGNGIILRCAKAKYSSELDFQLADKVKETVVRLE